LLVAKVLWIVARNYYVDAKRFWFVARALLCCCRVVSRALLYCIVAVVFCMVARKCLDG